MEDGGEGGRAEEDEVFLERGVSGLQLKEEEEDGCERGGACKVQNGGRRKTKHAPPPPLRLDASCSSLSSPATSPTGSSLSSLDSAFSQYSTDYASANGAIPQAELSPLVPGRLPEAPAGDASPPRREAPPLCAAGHTPPHQHGLHPNTWLKKDRRLSLRTPDGAPSEEEDRPSGDARDAAGSTPNCRRRSSSPPSYQQALQQLQRGRSPFYRGAEKPLTIRELRQLHDARRGPAPAQPPRGVFFGQSATALVLQRQKSIAPAAEGHRGSRTLPRRASEPTEAAAAAASSLTLDRAPRGRPPLPQDGGGLRVSEVEPHHHHAAAEPRFCLSPSATRAVRDYFSAQGPEDAGARLRRSQEVALALAQGKREWQSRRCSDPRADDFDQLFFAEESYV